ncbi:secretin N-terminal domain-containing protein [Burkholderia sp. Ac-20353]|uniref:secretin N-terminal domain-containing protein n=1 Tax=Burkholderia sp. Ac-20353 TaxID=2703894 RepID=UPI00197B82A4|nr:secretin N-terminal domain-containing protein [Burkholderia sp. Ac-20353]MBN3788934.1 general secretion pathway protein GspD [Burkholderia sp. Ac-20353]
MSPKTLLFSIVLVAILSACGSERALREAHKSFDAGKVDESLATLRAELKHEPTNAALRATYLQLRDQAIVTWLEAAKDATRKGSPTIARDDYQKVLKLDPDNDRAKSGLQQLDADALHANWLDQARTMAARKDVDAAIALLRKILAEDPANGPARTLSKSLEEQLERPPVNLQMAAALKRVLSIDFKDATLGQIFEVLSRTSGINFVFDKDVRTDQKTSVFLTSTTVKEAIDVVLMTNQLEERTLDRKTMLIYPNTPAKLKDYKSLTVRTFFLAHADPEQVANTLKTIVKTRDLIVDKKESTVIMRDSPEAVSIAEKLVQLLDLPDPEVMLEVEILEVDRDRLSSLGIKYPDQLTLTPLTNGSNNTLTLADLGRLTTAGVGATITPLTVNASLTTTDANLLANPRIRVRSRETAKILIGDKVPNITSTSTATGFVSSNVQYLDVGLKLEVTPVIASDGEVEIKINLEVSNIANQLTTSQGTIAYQIGTRSAATVLRLKDGENQVLAGLINDDDTRSANRVPGLGQLPILGRLFSSHQNDSKKTEIVLSITPHLIRSLPSPDARLLAFDSGTESNSRSLERSDAGGNLVAPSTSPAALPAVSKEAPSGGAVAATPASASSTINPSPGVPGTSASGPSVGSSANGGSDTTNGTAQATWLAPAQAKVGEPFTVQLVVNSSLPVTGIPLAIGYDPKKLEVASVVEGDFLKQGGVPTSFQVRADSATGQIYVTDTYTGDGQAAGAGATGQGAVLTATFKPISSANPTSLAIVSMTPLGQNGTTVPLALPAPQAIVVVP